MYVAAHLRRTLGALSLVMAGTIAAAPPASAQSAYDFEFQSIDGQPMRLDQWRGKALLVVNTASFCGYTRQYAGLQELWRTFEGKGLVVIGVPSNDFGDQEPQGEGDIKKFCEGAFNVSFPMTAKQKVTGDGAHPFYRWVVAQPGSEGEPAWNFHKVLIGRDGRLVRSFSSQQTPTSDEVVSWIGQTLLNSPPAVDPIQN